MLKTLFSFEGRVNRKFYWIFFAAFLAYTTMIGLLGTGVEHAYIAIAKLPRHNKTSDLITVGVVVLLGSVGVVACLSVMVRRIQDHNYSLRWLLIGATVFVLTLIALNMRDPRMGVALRSWDYWYILDMVPYAVSLMLGGILLPIFYIARYFTVADTKFLITLPLMAYGLWFLYVAGFRRGTVGPNRFGPDPVGKSRP